MSPLPGAWPVYPSLGESLWKRTTLPGKGPRAVAFHNDTVYVAEYYSDSIVAVQYQGDGRFQMQTIPLGPEPQLSLVRRGQMLFDDATLCYQHWQSCASCHPDARADALNWDLMNDGVGNPKNSKSMLLSHQTPPAMVRGVRETAEVAVRSGLVHILFAYRPEDEPAAMDAYLQTLQSVPSPYLRDGQLSAAAERGRLLFESPRVACHRCHPAPFFTDMQLHRMGRTPSRHFKNEFDTPTLREVWRTAPYLHDGQYITIQDMLRDGKHGLRPDANLTEQELEDLAHYVLSL
jgi:cytochrome c peroxidase